MTDITVEFLRKQEEQFGKAFAASDVELARSLYQPDVVYISPTVRLFEWPQKILGIEQALEFIQLTIMACEGTSYEAVELWPSPDGKSAYVRVHFDWDAGSNRLRSNYVIVYRYKGGLIAQQELYYDPNGRLEVLSGPPLED